MIRLSDFRLLLCNIRKEGAVSRISFSIFPLVLPDSPDGRKTTSEHPAAVSYA